MIAELQARQAKLENTLRWLNRTLDLREGYCRCGCEGRPTYGQYLIGHANRKLQSVLVDLRTGCWNWVKGINHGYGIVNINVGGRFAPRHAHQLVWKRVNGDIPVGLELDHKCRNRKCVNPLHLRPVTSAQNTRCGAKAKLTEVDIPQIRQLSSVGLSSRKIASRYNVSHKCILAVVNGDTWRDIG